MKTKNVIIASGYRVLSAPISWVLYVIGSWKIYIANPRNKMEKQIFFNDDFIELGADIGVNIVEATIAKIRQ